MQVVCSVLSHRRQRTGLGNAACLKELQCTAGELMAESIAMPGIGMKDTKMRGEKKKGNGNQQTSESDPLTIYVGGITFRGA